MTHEWSGILYFRNDDFDDDDEDPSMFEAELALLEEVESEMKAEGDTQESAG